MAWLWTLTKVPWQTVLRHAPTIVEGARAFYAASRTRAGAREPDDRPRGGIESLRRAVTRLEEREVQQAALFADLARQFQEMATALDALRTRLVLAFWGAGAAIVLALVVAVLLLWRG